MNPFLHFEILLMCLNWRCAHCKFFVSLAEKRGHFSLFLSPQDVTSLRWELRLGVVYRTMNQLTIYTLQTTINLNSLPAGCKHFKEYLNWTEEKYLFPGCWDTFLCEQQYQNYSNAGELSCYYTALTSTKFSQGWMEFLFKHLILTSQFK